MPVRGSVGQITVSEDILADVTWQADAGPYQITQDITVGGGATLTVLPGTVVEFGFSGTIFVGDGARVVADSVEFRPIHTRGLKAAFFQHDVPDGGHVEIHRSTVENLYLHSAGRGGFIIEDTRFTGEAHLRLYGQAPVRVTRCTFAGDYPIHTKIDLPISYIEDNVFSENAVLFHSGAERIVRDDTIRTYQNLPHYFNNNVSVSQGARLTALPGTEIRLGYFDSFLVNGGATLELRGVRIRPADGSTRFPAIIVSLGDGAAHAEISDSIIEDVYLEFSGGTGVVARSDFDVSPGDPALVNTGSTSIVATGNFWNGENGPRHASNPVGDGAAVNGLVVFDPWSNHPHASSSTWVQRRSDASFRLDAPYPNPASTATVFHYEVSSASHVQWDLFDVLGRRVLHSTSLNFRSSGSVMVDVSSLPSGSYLFRFSADGGTQTSQIVVIR